jgi:thiol-disulfide isomerase/thioredoxin
MSNVSEGIRRIDRRRMLAGIAGAAALAALPARADAPSPLAHGALADNKLAQAFVAAPDSLPDILVDTLDGTTPIGDLLKGRTVLMPVWAEWCVPCMIEIPDFARLQKTYGNDKFAILPVLSRPEKQMTPAAIAALFGVLHADNLAPTAEHKFGGKLAQAMARKGGTFAIPCNLVIAPGGRVVAREIGLETNGHDVATDPNDRYIRAERAAAGETQSLWGGPEGDAFVKALAGGFLA